MKKLIGMAAIAGFAAMSVGVALAAGNAQSGPTVGDCISDGFYGNEPNIVGPFAPGGPAEQAPGTKGGRVVASQSPGPFVTNPITGEVTKGNSIAFYNDAFGPGAVPKACQALTRLP